MCVAYVLDQLREEWWVEEIQLFLDTQFGAASIVSTAACVEQEAGHATS